jgi:hypothetical protein
MKQRIFFLALVVFAIVLGFHEKAQSRPRLPAQDLSARCVATVPTEWGEYEGANTSRQSPQTYHAQRSLWRKPGQNDCHGEDSRQEAGIAAQKANQYREDDDIALWDLPSTVFQCSPVIRSYAPWSDGSPVVSHTRPAEKRSTP